MTNLSRASHDLGPSTYIATNPCTAGLWSHPRLTYIPNPPETVTKRHKDALVQPTPSDLHTFIQYRTHNHAHIGLITIHHTGEHIHSDAVRGADQTQALCQVVKATLQYGLTLSSPRHIVIWLRSKTLPMKILSLEPHSATSITADIHTLLTTYLNRNDANTVDLRTFDRTWRGTPSKRAIHSVQPAIQAASTADAPWWMIKPWDTMWKAIKADYVPSHKSSHSACAPPNGNSPTPTLLAASKSKSRLLFSTITCLATGHCFDASYSIHFCPTMDNTLTCPCETLARGADDHAIIFTYPHSD